MAKLSRDPRFVANKRRREQEELRLSNALKAEEGPLLSDLKSVGVSVETVWDLVNTREPYPSAVPVLMQHLSEPYSIRIKEGIARALTVPYGGRDALAAVMEEFERQNATSENSLKWVLGNAIAVLAGPADAEVLIQLATDTSNGKSREMIVLALPRLVKDKTRLHRILRDLQKDEDVGAFAKRAKNAARTRHLD